MFIHFENPQMLGWLWLVPAAAFLFRKGAKRRRRELAAFGVRRPPAFRRREAFGVCAALAFTVLALARPGWGWREVASSGGGRDLVFLLDVSRSMLADDLFPNRLECAKTAIADCLDDLDGDRVALVLFAGSAEIRCPLTTDYEFFRMTLRQASPESVSVGGTRLDEALAKVAEKLLDRRRAGRQTVFLITDGEDHAPQAGELAAARKIAEAGAQLVCIGIGDRRQGARIVVEGKEGRKTYLTHDHREVWSRLHSETLRRLAEAVPGGVYYEIGTGPLDLRPICRQIFSASGRAAAAGLLRRPKERFQWFIAAAVGVLFLTYPWRERR